MTAYLHLQPMTRNVAAFARDILKWKVFSPIQGTWKFHIFLTKTSITTNTAIYKFFCVYSYEVCILTVSLFSSNKEVVGSNDSFVDSLRSVN